MKLEEEGEKGGEDEGRKVTRSGWDRETGPGAAAAAAHPPL